MGLIGYARTSASRATARLTEQEEQLKREGCSVVFSDRGSGGDAYRPGLTKALDALEPGDILVVQDINRLSRDWRQRAPIFYKIFAEEAGIKSISDHIDINPESGDLVLEIVSAHVQDQMDYERSKRQWGKSANAEQSPASQDDAG